MFQVSVLSEVGRLRFRELDRQTVLQRGADEVFRAEARAGVHQEDVVGQVPQTRTPEESLHQGQHLVLMDGRASPARTSRRLPTTYRVTALPFSIICTRIGVRGRSRGWKNIWGEGGGVQVFLTQNGFWIRDDISKIVRIFKTFKPNLT